MDAPVSQQEQIEYLSLEVNIKDAEVRNLRMKLDSLKILEIRNQKLEKENLLLKKNLDKIRGLCDESYHKRIV